MESKLRKKLLKRKRVETIEADEGKVNEKGKDGIISHAQELSYKEHWIVVGMYLHLLILKLPLSHNRTPESAYLPRFNLARLSVSA